MPGLSHKSENVTVVVIGFGETREHVQRELSIVLILTALSEVYEIIVFDQMYCTIYDYLPNLKHRLARKKTFKDGWRSLDNRADIEVSEDLSQCFDSSIYHRLLLANWNVQVRFDVLICSGPQTVKLRTLINVRFLKSQTLS